MNAAVPRHDWSLDEVMALMELPFNDLLFRAQQVHRAVFDPNEIQRSSLLSVKSGGCPEDCKYCAQSVHNEQGVPSRGLMGVEEVVAAARRAREAGATRFCIGAAWRAPTKGRAFARVLEMIRRIKDLGMEACATLGMLDAEQAEALRAAGLDYYNHNLDSDPEFYRTIISTRRYQDRLDTLKHVRAAGLRICCGGIVGMGESRRHRAGLIVQLARMAPHPESVPINMLVPIAGTGLADAEPLDVLEFVRTIAAARITMPRSRVRLSAGRHAMSDEAQALCFLAGANSIFYGEKLLTADNADVAHDEALFARLGLRGAEGKAIPSERRLDCALC
ncbi:MAG: biotin synthase BioB [Zetaproteobacteria bacterium]|nr:MAG: biotin synthase BioB [Zetaproteobacteria bacterium]